MKWTLPVANIDIYTGLGSCFNQSPAAAGAATARA